MRGRSLRLPAAVLEAALAAALAVALVGCANSAETSGSTGAEAPKTPIKIGAVVSLTGTYAGLGVPEKNTIEMEVKRINEAGGVNGHQLEVIFEDDATDDAKANAAASKLIEQDQVVALIGATGTGGTMAMRQVVDRAEVPQVSMAGGTVITEQFDPLVFQTPWSNKIVMPYTLEALKADGITKIGVISDSGGFGKDGAAVVESEAKTAGITITSSQTFNAGDTDMSAQLTKIKGSGAEALLMITAGKEASTVLKNAKDLGMTMPIFGTHGNARKEFIEGSGGAAEGVKLAAGKILVPEAYGEDTEAYKVATDFVERYTAAYGEEPNTFAGHAYDAINLIAGAVSRIDGDVTSQAIRDELEKTSGFVGIGGTFNFSATDHNGLTKDDLTLYIVKDDAFQLAE